MAEPMRCYSRIGQAARGYSVGLKECAAANCPSEVLNEQALSVATRGTPDNDLSAIFPNGGGRGRSVAEDMRGGAIADASEGKGA